MLYINVCVWGDGVCTCGLKFDSPYRGMDGDRPGPVLAGEPPGQEMQFSKVDGEWLSGRGAGNLSRQN